MMDRRTFLKAAATALAGLGAVPALARAARKEAPAPKAVEWKPTKLDGTVKLSPELEAYFTSDIDKVEFMQDGSVRDLGARWWSLGDARFPINHYEPHEIVDIYKRFEAHPRGIVQKTFKMSLPPGSLIKGMVGPGSEVVIRIDWHVEDASVDEREYILARIHLIVLAEDRDVVKGEFTKYGHLTP